MEDWYETVLRVAGGRRLRREDVYADYQKWCDLKKQPYMKRASVFDFLVAAKGWQHSRSSGERYLSLPQGASIDPCLPGLEAWYAEDLRQVAVSVKTDRWSLYQSYALHSLGRDDGHEAKEAAVYRFLESKGHVRHNSHRQRQFRGVFIRNKAVEQRTQADWEAFKADPWGHTS